MKCSISKWECYPDDKSEMVDGDSSVFFLQHAISKHILSMEH